MLFFPAGVAQLVEHLTCNQGVASSIPAAGTKFKNRLIFGLSGFYFFSQIEIFVNPFIGRFHIRPFATTGF